MSRANLYKNKKVLTNTTAASKFIPRRTWISINWNPPFRSHSKNFSKTVFYEVNLVSQCSHLEVLFQWPNFCLGLLGIYFDAWAASDFEFLQHLWILSVRSAKILYSFSYQLYKSCAPIIAKPIIKKTTANPNRHRITRSTHPKHPTLVRWLSLTSWFWFSIPMKVRTFKKVSKCGKQYMVSWLFQKTIKTHYPEHNG